MFLRAASSTPKLSRDDWIMRAYMGVVCLYILATLALPLYVMFSKSFENPDGEFIGFANYLEFLTTPALSRSVVHSLQISIISTAITVPLAFVFAYALMRSRMPAKGLFKTIALLPILVPSLVPGLALVYLFGRQGFLNALMFGHDIYGPIGIVISEVFFTFPHALLILITALSITDERLYEVARSLKTSKVRIFFTVTLPGARYGLISAVLVVFTLVFTDFGAPKVIGGQFNVLATDIYKQVIGQQNFQMGAVVSVILLLPAALAFMVERLVQRRQVAMFSAGAVPYHPKPHWRFDMIMLGCCCLVSVLILGILGMCQYAALIKFFPYDLSFTLEHYLRVYNRDFGGMDTFYNSLRMACYVAILGTILIFTGAYMVEKGRGFGKGRAAFQFLAMMPMAVPGMVLGLAYIFFFNAPDNPLNAIYNTMTILVICTITHFYTVAHLTAITALKQMDAELEAISASLKQPFYITLWRVTLPICLPAVLDIALYLFVNAMTTVSAVVFLWGPDTNLAAVSVLQLEDFGHVEGAAGLSTLILYTNVAVRIVHHFATRAMERHTQLWRTR